MTSGTRLLVTMGALLLGIGYSSAGAQTASPTPALPASPNSQANAMAELIGSDGSPKGKATFLETPNGVLIQLRLEQIAAGEHAIHIHEMGQCQPPNFQSAGSHYNPSNAPHGLLLENGPHAGDLPNIFAQENGTVQADILTNQVTFSGGPNSLFKDGGTALVVHAKGDDYQTNPAGASGDRIACGVIARAK
jgi:Cu-Zn family superoxide dismutase